MSFIVLSVNQWFNTCTVANNRNYMASFKPGFYLVQTELFVCVFITPAAIRLPILFFSGADYWVCLVNFSNSTSGCELLWTITEVWDLAPLPVFRWKCQQCDSPQFPEIKFRMPKWLAIITMTSNNFFLT